MATVNLVPGLERVSSRARNPATSSAWKITPADGYGEFNKALVQKVPRRALKGIKNLNVGMRLHAQTPQGPQCGQRSPIFRGDMVTLDGNHPLAGQNLNFDIEIADVRAATQEELEHGHVRPRRSPSSLRSDEGRRVRRPPSVLVQRAGNCALETFAA